MKFFIISLIKPKADAYQLHYPGKKKTKIFTQYHDTMSNSMIYNVKISSYGDKHHQIMKHEHIKTNYRMLCYVNVPSNEEPSV